MTPKEKGIMFQFQKEMEAKIKEVLGIDVETEIRILQNWKDRAKKEYRFTLKKDYMVPVEKKSIHKIMGERKGWLEEELIFEDKHDRIISFYKENELTIGFNIMINMDYFLTTATYQYGEKKKIEEMESKCFSELIMEIVANVKEEEERKGLKELALLRVFNKEKAESVLVKWYKREYQEFVKAWKQITIYVVQKVDEIISEYSDQLMISLNKKK